MIVAPVVFTVPGTIHPTQAWRGAPSWPQSMSVGGTGGVDPRAPSASSRVELTGKAVSLGRNCSARGVLMALSVVVLLASACRSDPTEEVGRATFLEIFEPARADAEVGRDLAGDLAPVLDGGTLEDVRRCTFSARVFRMGCEDGLCVESYSGGELLHFPGLDAWLESLPLEGRWIHVLLGKAVEPGVKDRIVTGCRARQAHGVVFERARAFLPQYFEIVKLQ